MVDYNKGEIFIEFTTIGNSLKVTAICSITGDEVSMVADKKAPMHRVKELAARKLRYVQAKKYHA